MDNFTGPAGATIGKSVDRGLTSRVGSHHHNVSLQDRKHDTKVEPGTNDSEVAIGTASLGRAAQPPPSEKSSTLDAKDSRRPLLDEEACSFDAPIQSESAVSSSAMLIPGTLQSRRRVPRLVAVSIPKPPSPPPPPPASADNEAKMGPLTPPLLSDHTISPHVPPRPWHQWWSNSDPSSDHDYLASPLSPVRNHAPPLPPKTYLKDFPQPMPTPYCEAPPLPQRLYFPENEEVRGFQLSIEELNCAGVFCNGKSEALLPLEEEGENDDEVARGVKPLTTVLLPREFKHSHTAPCDLHLMYIEKNCQKCQKMKKFVRSMLFDRSHICDCCKKKKIMARRSST